jgi:hypothetical protein
MTHCYKIIFLVVNAISKIFWKINVLVYYTDTREVRFIQLVELAVFEVSLQ